MKKTTVYAKADEKFVKAVVLYADASKKLFYDEAAKVDKVMKADLADLFLTGIVVSMAGTYYTPVCLKEAGLIANDGTATALTFTAA